MQSTALVAETLIIGLLTALWLALLVVAIFGVPPVDDSVLKSWDVVLGLYVVAVAYTLGILFDRISAYLLRPMEDSLWESLRTRHPTTIRLEPGRELPRIDELREALRNEASTALAEADDLRRPLRITRATCVSLVFLLPTLAILAATGHPFISSGITVRVAAFSTGFLLLCLWAYWALEIQYYRRLVVAYRVGGHKVQSGQLPSGADPSPKERADSVNR